MRRVAAHGLVAAVLLAACESASTPADTGNADDALRTDSPGAIEIRRVGPTVTVRGTLPKFAPTETGAKQLVAKYPGVFGMGSNDALEGFTAGNPSDGADVIRLRRTHKELPVFAGELRVGFSTMGDPVFVQAPAVEGLDVDPNATANVTEAESAALDAATAWGPNPRVHDASLGVFVPLLFGIKGDPVLAYRVELGFDGGTTHTAFVDASTESIAFEFGDRAEALERTVYEWQGDKDWYPEHTAPVLMSEGDPEPAMDAPDLEVQAYEAYLSAGLLHEFLMSRYGWDSWDGKGEPLHMFVGYPEANAHWYGASSVFGDGFAAPDIVAHEYGHALVDALVQRPFGSLAVGLVRCGESIDDRDLIDNATACAESQALDEWIGDTIAAFRNWHDANLDCPNDSSQCWHVESRDLLIRDMSQRDKRTVIHYSEVRDRLKDEHRNSAVPSLATYLLADPNPEHPLGAAAPDFRPIGLEKVSEIWFRALRTYTRSSATFDDVRYTWLRACEDLVELGRVGMELKDCGAVLNGWAAVGVGEPDEDEDTWHDDIDNCPKVFNPDQVDDDGNNVGNACEEGDSTDTAPPDVEAFFPCPAEFPSAIEGPWPLVEEWPDDWTTEYAYMCRYERPATLTNGDVDEDNFSFQPHWWATADDSQLGCGKPPNAGRETQDTISQTHYAWVSHNTLPLGGQLGAEFEIEFHAFIDDMLETIATGAEGEMVPQPAACP